VIWRAKNALVQGSNYLSLDLGAFPAGVYYVVVVRQDGSRAAVMVEKL